MFNKKNMIKKLLLTAVLGFSATAFSQTVVFQEDFEDPAKRALWTISELDGDGDTWEFLDAQANTVDSFQGYFAASFSWYFEAFTPDNILKSPVFTLPEGNHTLSFKAAAGDEELFEEHYAVYVIPAASTFTGTETPVFEETIDAGYLSEAKIVQVDISSFAGQDVKIVFRHYNCTDIFYMGIDDVIVTDNTLSVSDSDVSKVKIYPNPASDYVKIDNVKDFKFARIIDMSGKIVKESKETQINLESLPKGQYLINIVTEKEVFSKKILKK